MLFDANRARLEEVESQLGAHSDELQESRTALTITRTEQTARLTEIGNELRSLQSRPNLLPLPQLELRRRLCDGTGIAETALPYAGELLRVRDGEGAWEGAAERTLHGFALSLLVPAEHYAAVSSWVDANNLRRRLVYLRIGESPAPRAAEPGTLAAKIAIKPSTPFRNFLLDELATRFDHVCCDTVEDFRRYPKALTVNGQLKGGRGRHEKDDRRELEKAEAEIAFVGKAREAKRFQELAECLAGLDPQLAVWAARRPLKLLELDDDVLSAARAALWLRDNPTPGIYVRQLGLPGVHTKFIERHRQVIDQLLAGVAPGSDMDEVEADTEPPMETPAPDVALDDGAGRTPAARFARRHGFLHPPELVRFRVLDPAILVLGDARDITVTAEAFSALQLPVHTVIATENLVNFLALPERPGTLALYGAGYGFSSLRDAAWLRECEVLYWGDLDTHGFRILDQLRAVHPHVASVLMDEETLLAHHDAWGREPSPSRAALTRLTAEEAALYEALGNDTYGSAVRLEQELIRWDWALKQLGG